MNNPQSDSDLVVKTVDEDGKAPKRRIATPFAAYTAYTQAKQFNSLNDIRFGHIMGIYNGFPPTPPKVMDEMGMGDMPNVNTKQFQAKVDTYSDNWNAVNAAGSEWLEVIATHDDPMEADRRSKYLTKCANEAIKQWDSTGFSNGNQYILNSAVRDRQMGLFGIGVSFFVDPIDWRWKVIPTRKVIVPEGTNVWLDNCTALFIEDDMSVTDLYALRKKPGWNEDAILRVLYLKLNQSQNQNRWDGYAEWVNKVRQNDLFIATDFSPFRFVHVFSKEFLNSINEGSITHGIICEEYGWQAGDSNPTSKEAKEQSWLYEKTDIAERWPQILCVFADNAGPEGRWHGVKGFGDLIFDGCHFNNLMFNRTANSAIVANMPMFTSSNEGDRQKLSQVKITQFGILQPGLSLEQVRVNVDIKSAMDMFNLGTNIINSNSRQFPQNDRTVGGEAPTATQVNYDRADEARFTNLQISFYRATGLDCMFSEMYRRLAQPASKYPESWPGGKVAKQFREKAKEYGIPEADLLKVKTVRGSRSVGSGNMGLDVMRADQALSVATPGQGQLNARKLKIEALYGCDMVPALVEEKAPPPNQDDVQIDNDNLAIQSGQTPAAFGFQPHEKHLGVGTPGGHIPLLAEIEQVANQMMEQGVEVNIEAAEKIHKALTSGIEHANQHVAFMAELPRTKERLGLFEEQVKELNKVLNDLTQLAEAFGEAIQAAQQQAQPQGQMTPEQMKTQAEIERKNALAANDMEIKRAQAENKAQNDAIKGQIKNDNQVASHELKLGMEAEKKAFELESNRAAVSQDLNAKAAQAGLDIVKSQMEAEQKKEQMAAAD